MESITEKLTEPSSLTINRTQSFVILTKKLSAISGDRKVIKKPKRF
jgi:hypothetical protein